MLVLLSALLLAAAGRATDSDELAITRVLLAHVVAQHPNLTVVDSTVRYGWYLQQDSTAANDADLVRARLGGAASGLLPVLDKLQLSRQSLRDLAPLPDSVAWESEVPTSARSGSAVTLLGISRVAIAADHQHAIVYRGTYCGSRCGDGWLYLFTRRARVWVATDSVRLWVS